MEQKQIKQILDEVVNKTILIPYLVGPHGIGKTSFIKDWVKERNRSLFILNLSAVEPADLTGIPVVTEEKTVWSRPSFFDYDVLFLDEINRVIDPSVKAALLSLFVDRSINGHKYKGVIVAAGNSGDDYEVSEFDPAFKDRLIQIDFKPNLNFIKNKQFKTFIKSNDLLNRYSLRRLSEAEKFLDSPEVMKLILDPVTVKTWESFIAVNKKLSLTELVNIDLSTIDKIAIIDAVIDHDGDFDEKLAEFLADLSAEIWSLLMQKVVKSQNEVFQQKLAKCLQSYPHLWSDEKRWVLLECLRQAVTAA